METQNSKTSWKVIDQSAASIQAGDVRVTPRSRAVRVVGKHGGWVWNTPLDVVVEHQDSTRSIPIINLTRWLTAILFIFSALFITAGLVISKQKRGKEHG